MLKAKYATSVQATADAVSEAPSYCSNPNNSPLMTFSAVLTWCAIVLSEFFQLNALTRAGFIAAAVTFLSTFLLENRRLSLGWSPALVLMALSAAAAVYLGGFGVTPALYVIGGVKLYEKLPRGQFWLVILALNALLFGRLLMSNSALWVLSSFAAYLGFQLFGLMMVSSSQALQTANIELRSINTELISTRALLSESARAQERLSLSRELHDVCGHKLTALKLTLRGRGDSGALEASERAMCQTLTDELLSDIRAVVATLREHEGIDLAQALGKLGSGWKRPLVSVSIDPNVHVPNLEHAVALLRVAQEGLTNAVRHSDAAKVEISLTQEDDSALKPNSRALVLSVSDDGMSNGILGGGISNGGKRTTKLVRGNGLNGMAERLATLGGSLEIKQLAQGLRLAARLPLPADAPL